MVWQTLKRCGGHNTYYYCYIKAGKLKNRPQSSLRGNDAKKTSVTLLKKTIREYKFTVPPCHWWEDSVITNRQRAIGRYWYGNPWRTGDESKKVYRNKWDGSKFPNQDSRRKMNQSSGARNIRKRSGCQRHTILAIFLYLCKMQYITKCNTTCFCGLIKWHGRVTVHHTGYYYKGQKSPPNELHRLHLLL